MLYNNMKTVAIVDDDEIQQLMIKKMIDVLQIAGRTFSFFSAKEALDYINENCRNNSLLPDIILLDINMPGMNGFEFLQHFNELTQALTKKINIYMLSSSIDSREITLAKSNSNVTDFISKPLRIEKIKEIISTEA
jgi:CheY-like chemotaxis protein